MQIDPKWREPGVVAPGGFGEGFSDDYVAGFRAGSMLARQWVLEEIGVFAELLETARAVRVQRRGNPVKP